jgi:hypothetical protein
MCFGERESGLLEIKKMMLQSIYTWKVAWNSVHISNFSLFLETCAFSIF